MKNFLKFISVFVLVILVSAISVNAEGGINANEQAILEKIQTIYRVGEKEYTVPEEYFNQARNFFLTTNLSKAESDEIISYIDEGLELLESQVERFDSANVNFEKFDSSVKAKILDLGQKAAAVIDLKLVYVGGNVTITDTAGKTVFSGTAVIKVTGVNHRHLIFGAVSFTVIAATYVTCLLAFRKQKQDNE